MNAKYDEIQINTDGGSRGNPGPAAIGAVATSGQETIFQISQKIGINTNNVAEYQAVLVSLQKISESNISAKKLSFVLDSELVVKQINGLYKVKQDHLLELKNKITSELNNLKNKDKISQYTFSHVLREKNKEADKLVNLALDS